MTSPAVQQPALFLDEPSGEVFIAALDALFHRGAVPLERAVVELGDGGESDAILGLILLALFLVRTGELENLIAYAAAEALVRVSLLALRALVGRLGSAACIT